MTKMNLNQIQEYKLVESNLIKQLLRIKKKKSWPLHEPVINAKSINHVKKCLNSTWVSTQGEYVKKFEKLLSNKCKTKYAIATSSGTSALHLALKSLGLDETQEVLVSPLTFVSTINAISYCNSMPHFIDVEKNTLGVDLEYLDNYLSKNFKLSKNKDLINKKTLKIVKILMPIYVLGHPINFKNLKNITRKYNLKVVFDGAESLGTKYNNKPLQTYGDLSVLSFNGNKVVTTGAGGAILTNNSNLQKKIRHLASNSKMEHPYLYIHDKIGYNYLMPALSASLGYSQLENLDMLIKKKKIYCRKV